MLRSATRSSYARRVATSTKIPQMEFSPSPYCPDGAMVLHFLAMELHFVTVQDRGRVNVSRLASHEQYRVTVEDDGTMVWEPAETHTIAELQLLANPELIDSIKKSLADPSRHVTRERTRERIPLN